MKNIVTLILAAGLFVYAITGNAAPKDSSWLASESVMTSVIEKSTDDLQLGTISIGATADPIPDGWLECNGQAVDTSKYPEYVAKFGATTPDYRGFFLRGHGGKSGALGVAQDYAVQTNGKNTVAMSGLGVGELDYVSGIEYFSPSVSKKRMMTLSEYAIDQAMKNYSGSEPRVCRH